MTIVLDLYHKRYICLDSSMSEEAAQSNPLSSYPSHMLLLLVTVVVVSCMYTECVCSDPLLPCKLSTGLQLRDWSMPAATQA